MIEPQLDPTGSLIVEIRSDPDVLNLVSDRVRGTKPAAGDVADPYKTFVVLVCLAAPPHPRLPITEATYAVSCYGTTGQNAWAIWGAVVKAIHAIGPRTKSNGLGIYQSLIAAGGEESEDPDTKQPVVQGTLTLIATTQAVTTD